MAWSGMTNRTPVRDRSGTVGWRRRFVVPLKPGNAGGGKPPVNIAQVESSGTDVAEGPAAETSVSRTRIARPGAPGRGRRHTR